MNRSFTRNNTSIRAARRRVNENKAPTAGAPTRIRRRRSSAGMSYLLMRDRIINLANREHQAQNQPPIEGRPSAPRRISYITIVTESPEEPSKTIQLDFSEDEMHRLASHDPLDKESIEPVQWSWGGWDNADPFGAAFEPTSSKPELEIIPDFNEPESWGTKLKEITSSYTSTLHPDDNKHLNLSQLERHNTLNSLHQHLLSLSSLLDANASTLMIALSRLQDSIKPREESSRNLAVDFDDDEAAFCGFSSAAVPSPRRAEKQPSSEDALERAQSTANEIINLAALVAEGVLRLPKSA